MDWPATLVLVPLWLASAVSPEAGAPGAPPPLPADRDRPGAEDTANAPPAAPADPAPAAPNQSTTEADTPAPDINRAGSERSTSTPAVADPWASVPIQSVVRRPSAPDGLRPFPRYASSGPGPSVPLLDPWSTRPRRTPPRSSQPASLPAIQPDLRDPFGDRRRDTDGADDPRPVSAPSEATERLAHSDLRDPFAARSRAGAQSRPSSPAPVPSPLPPELRDPFAR